MTDEVSFEVEWPPVAARLEGALRRRRVPAPMVEDLVQETGLRLFEIWERVDPARELWPLALTIALNRLRDHIRADNRRQEVAVPGNLTEHDTETAALARVELGRVQEALVQLTDGQRDALLAEVGAGTESGVSASATKMLRMRARKRLRALMDGASGLVASLGSVAQRALRSGTASTLGDQLAPGASLAAGMFWTAAALGGLGAVGVTAPSWGSQPPGRAEAPAVADAGGDVHERAAGTFAAQPQRTPPEPYAAARDGGGVDADKRTHSTPTERRRRVDHRRDQPEPEPEPEPVRVHEPKASVGPSGYEIKGGVSGSVAGHTAHAVFSVTSQTNGPSEGCGDGSAPADVCNLHPKGGVSAQVDDRNPVEVRAGRRGLRSSATTATVTGQQQ